MRLPQKAAGKARPACCRVWTSSSETTKVQMTKERASLREIAVIQVKNIFCRQDVDLDKGQLESTAGRQVELGAAKSLRDAGATESDKKATKLGLGPGSRSNSFQSVTDQMWNSASASAPGAPKPHCRVSIISLEMSLLERTSLTRTGEGTPADCASLWALPLRVPLA